MWCSSEQTTSAAATHSEEVADERTFFSAHVSFFSYRPHARGDGRGTQGRVLLNALLPRGDGNKRKKSAPVVGSAADGSPVRSFSPLITKVNAALRSWAETDTSRRVG